MSDFSAKNTEPSVAEYLAATEAELLDRLNKNPAHMDSELPFIQSVIAVRTAESQRATNEALVKENVILVYTILAVSLFTILAPIASSYLSNLCRTHPSSGTR